MKCSNASPEAPIRVRWDLVMIRTRMDNGLQSPLISAKYPDVELDVLVDAAREQSRALRNLNIHRAMSGEIAGQAPTYHECYVYVSSEGIEFPVHHLMTRAQALALFEQEKRSALLRARLLRREEMDCGLKIIEGGRKRGKSASIAERRRTKPFLKVLSLCSDSLCSTFLQPQPLR